MKFSFRILESSNVTIGPLPVVIAEVQEPGLKEYVFDGYKFYEVEYKCYLSLAYINKCMGDFYLIDFFYLYLITSEKGALTRFQVGNYLYV